MSLASLCLAVLIGAPPEITPPALEAPLVLPSPLPGRRDLGHTVVVQLTVGVDGVPSDLVVLSSPSPALSEIALAALRQARFRPATQGGVPIAVRIATPVSLVPAPTLVAAARREPEPSPVAPGSVAGRLLERGNRRPVAGVVVTLTSSSGADREELTDDEGRFTFVDVAAGTYRVEAPLFDEDGARATVRVRRDRVAPEQVTLRADAAATRDYRTQVIDSGSSVRDAARVRIPVERAREVPGSSGDPLKVLESLPGVARPAAAGPGAGDLSVRGSAPEDTQYVIDGLPLPQLYHFGSVYSVLQDEWIGAVDFRAGGFSSEYGNATGGLIEVTLKDLPRDGVHGHGDVNVYHAAGLATVPVGDDWTIGVAARRSWIDAILGGLDDVSFGTAPRYYDYQVRADYHPGDVVSLKLLAFGSDDAIVLLGSGPDGDDPEGSGFVLERAFHQLQGTLSVPLSNDLSFRLGAATGYETLRISPGSNDFRLAFDPLTVRGDLDWRASKRLRLRGGLLGQVARFKVELDLPRPTKEGQVALPSEVQEVISATEEGFSGRLDGWAEASYAVTDELTLLAGTRLLGYFGNFDAAALDARAAVGWEPVEALRLTLSGGLNHQAPAPDETAESLGNPELGPERAAYVNLSAQRRFGDLLSVELQGFYKALDALVVRTEPGSSVSYDNAGTGTIVGGEALIRLSHDVVDAWVAYTVSRSRRTDRPGEPERFFSFDQTHVLALVAGVRLGDGWRVGARLRYATGNPYTPLEPAYYDAGADIWVPRASGAPLSARSEAFVQLDLRLDKTFLFDTWKLDLYLEVNNATNQQNIELVQYSEDYRRRDDITNLGLTPSLGVRGSF